MSRLASKVAGRNQPIASELTLVTEVPLLLIHVVQVQREADVLSGGGECGVLCGRVRQRKRIAAGVALKRFGEAARRLSQAERIAPGRGRAKVSGRERLGLIEEMP